LKRNHVNVLVTHGYKSNLVGYLATRGSRVPQLPFVRGYTGEDWRIRRYEEMDRWLLRRLPRVLCVSQGTVRILQKHGFDPDACTVVHNAIDPGPGAAASPPDLARTLAIPERAPVLLAAGRLSPEKGQEFLIAALHHSHRSDLHLLLLGEGKEENRLRRLASDLGVSDRVRFLGFQRNVLGFMAAADLVVNPSLTEGLPNVVLEAFTTGTPVVATDVGGVNELVTPGRTGWLVPPGDARALAGTIEKALEDPGKARVLAENARRMVRDSFSFERQRERLTGLYEGALATGPDRRCGRGSSPPVSRRYIR
jgi:glycosyltransferase involved in cell wall biosynthesis